MNKTFVSPTDLREAKQDRFMYWHGVKHPARGPQMAFAMADAILSCKPGVVAIMIGRAIRKMQ